MYFTWRFSLCILHWIFPFLFFARLHFHLYFTWMFENVENLKAWLWDAVTFFVFIFCCWSLSIFPCSFFVRSEWRNSQGPVLQPERIKRDLLRNAHFADTILRVGSEPSSHVVTVTAYDLRLAAQVGPYQNWKYAWPKNPFCQKTIEFSRCTPRCNFFCWFWPWTLRKINVCFSKTLKIEEIK